MCEIEFAEVGAKSRILFSWFLMQEIIIYIDNNDIPKLIWIWPLIWKKLPATIPFYQTDLNGDLKSISLK